jgi:hypothetical protein
VLLPGAEALLTMKQYKLKSAGFVNLRVQPGEGGGTRLRLRLQPGAGEPVFDIRDGYVKVTVSTPKG